MKNMLIDPLKGLSEYNDLIEDIKDKKSPVSIHGIIDENLAHISYAINEDINKQLILVTYDERKAKALYEELKGFKDQIYYYSHEDPLFFKVDSFSMDIENERMKILSLLSNKKPIVVVTYIDAIVEKVMTQKAFKENF